MKKGEPMEVKKAHCFFEQSGTFKNEFIKLGIPAEDYDIQNNFGETDHVIDLFKEIDDAYYGNPSIFDNIKQDELIVAFYPCIYFCEKSMQAFYLTNHNYRCMDFEQKISKILEREACRDDFYRRLIKFVAVVTRLNIRMIFENPWTQPHFLKNNFLKNPDIIDMDRSKMGDDLKKPTAYWFFNCKPEEGYCPQPKTITKTIDILKGGIHAGICSEERSMINPDYARNWIKSYIIGEDDYSALPLLDAMM